MEPIKIPASQYHPFFKGYIDLVEEDSLIKALTSGMIKTIACYELLPESIWSYRYAEGKWTPKEVLLHTIDTERIFCYRALQIARSEKAQLAGFNENVFVQNSEANTRPVADLMREYKSVRTATEALFKSFSEDTMNKTGTANENPLSVNAAGYIICGHELHHINIIKERYVQ